MKKIDAKTHPDAQTGLAQSCIEREERKENRKRKYKNRTASEMLNTERTATFPR
jgi:hypothetical protein